MDKNLFRTIPRNFCVFSDAHDLEHLYTFNKFPVFMGVCDQEPKDDLFADMAWFISRSSGSIQLNPLLPLEIVYPEQHEAGAVGGIWMEHHKRFAQFIAALEAKNIFEIGAGHGILCKETQLLISGIQWAIVEPNTKYLQNVNAQVIQGYFTEHFSYDGAFDAVVHSHVFEHMYYPSEFIAHISQFVQNDTYHIFSIPNMQSQLEKLFTNCLNYEHTVLLSEPFVDYLLAKYGFVIIKKEYFGGHSIFYATVKKEKTISLPLPVLYNSNKSLFNNFISYHQKLIESLNKKIDGSNIPVYLFGAHIFSQYLLEFGLRSEQIISVLDNAPQKNGKRLYGTNLIVNSPKVLKGMGPVNIILKAGEYNHEIKNDIIGNINAEVTFWE
jgi:2-polyprenyl-3-methyl-5-hydroxy-6-metoxy-1,4-benzoquinol methylase